MIRRSRSAAATLVRRSRTLIVANHFLETELEKLKVSVSIGYTRGKLFEAAKGAAARSQGLHIIDLSGP